MPALKLRQEFLATHMRATAIELCNKQNTGWAQRKNPKELLEFTFPTADIQRALDGISTTSGGKPVMFIGQRGRGKSHIMAVLHHALASPETVEGWAHEWAPRVGSKKLQSLSLPRGFTPITETLSNQEYACLWDVVFDRHPKGQYYRGKFEQSGTSVPSKSLLQDMFSEQRTALVLDELQTWYDGKQDNPSDHGPKYRQWAFNFLQILSELADDRPDLLFLVASVRENTTDAFHQIRRVGPIVIDFKGETAREDRKQLLLHRLFENRTNFPRAEVEHIVGPYASERNRLLFADRTEADQERLRLEVADCWPFSPELLNLLEDNILMAAAAQDNRDSIRILAEVYRARGSEVPIVTPADFCVDDDACGVVTLIDSFATSFDQERLREKAQRNLQAIRDAKITAPHDRTVISSLWMRSLSVMQDPGGTRYEVQLDITRDSPVDDNSFTAELADIVDNSFNIHEVGTHEKRFCFKLPENPTAKLKAWARNDRSFDPETPAPPGLLPVSRDQKYLQDVINYVFKSPDGTAEQPSSPIILDANWMTAPWANVSQPDQPSKWHERGNPVLIVLPASPGETSQEVAATLGPWLVNNVPVNRNMVRFLLQKSGLPNVYADRDLIITARCALLAREWKDSEAQYTALHKRFEGDLKGMIAERFDRYAVLDQWDFQTPTNCTFHVEKHGSSGSKLPAVIEAQIKQHFFAPEDFRALVIDAARRGETMKQLLAQLRSEPLTGEQSIPYLGETAIYEEVLGVAAQDLIAINVGGTWLSHNPGESKEDAQLRLRARGWRTGRELLDVLLGLPSQVGAGGVAITKATQPTLWDSTASPGAPGGTTQPTSSTAPTAVLNNSSEPVAQPGAPAGTTPTVVAVPVIRQTMGAKTGINLLGELERWALPDAQKVNQASLTFNGVSIKELRELCTRLPPKLQAELQIKLPPE